MTEGVRGRGRVRPYPPPNFLGENKKNEDYHFTVQKYCVDNTTQFPLRNISIVLANFSAS